MAGEAENRLGGRVRVAQGFSMLELLASVTIITLLMSAVFAFMYQAQKRFQGNVVITESNQSARAALELITQEIGQAGFNPQFSPHKTCNQVVQAWADPQWIKLSDITGINPGDWLQVDTGTNNEIVQVWATSAGGGTPANPAASAGPPAYNPPSPATTAPWIEAVFEMNHNGSATPFPVISYKMPYPSGIIAPPALPAAQVPFDHVLEFFGDINNDGVIRYVVYSLAPTTSPATTVSVNGNTYTLYNLRRSITPVTFTAGAVNNPSSPLVQNVLYQDINATYAAPATPLGPTGQPIFSYPNTVVVGVVPNQVTVVGTILVTLSVAINPRSLESGRIEWYTMATQIRPLNLSAAVAVNQAGGAHYMVKLPPGLPMTYPTGY
jgi:prepilin-type N-terminal cleavage/methylation domain-containing protein